MISMFTENRHTVTQLSNEPQCSFPPLLPPRTTGFVNIRICIYATNYLQPSSNPLPSALPPRSSNRTNKWEEKLTKPYTHPTQSPSSPLSFRPKKEVQKLRDSPFCRLLRVGGRRGGGGTRTFISPTGRHPALAKRAFGRATQLQGRERM